MEFIIEAPVTIVENEITNYQRPALHGQTYLVMDKAHQIYSILFVPNNIQQHLKPGIILLVRIIEEMIVIDEDITDRPLYQALVRAGIPREKIILRYAGETLP
jgi:hypothetical protein